MAEKFWHTCRFAEPTADGVECQIDIGDDYKRCSNFNHNERCEYMKMCDVKHCVHCDREEKEPDDDWHKVRIFAGTNDEGRMVDVCPDCREIYWDRMREFMCDFLHLK